MPQLSPVVERHLAANILHLTILPTEQCNFRCVYCFENFEGGRMTPTVVTSLERFLARRAPGLDRLALAWFGGEPLLAADIVEELQAHVVSLARSNRGLQVWSSLTTNGFLLDRECLRRLLELGVYQYQVTLDGPREFHDRRRLRLGGQGTYDRIWANLEAARTIERDFQMFVRVHVDGQNLPAMPEFLEAYREAFGTDPRFSLFARPLSRFHELEIDGPSFLEGAEADRALESVRNGGRQLGLRQISFEEAQPICSAAAANSFVVRSDGTLGKCCVALDHPLNRVGRLLEDGRVELDTSKMKGWMRGLFSGDARARGCPMHGYADGLEPSAGEGQRITA